MTSWNSASLADYCSIAGLCKTSTTGILNGSLKLACVEIVVQFGICTTKLYVDLFDVYDAGRNRANHEDAKDVETPAAVGRGSKSAVATL